MTGGDAVIRDSPSRDLQQLVADLHDADAMRREAAVARLRVAGRRALARLAAVVREDPAPDAREAALRALDAIEDPAILDIALPAVDDPDSRVRLAAVGTLRPWVVREPGTRVLDRLAAAALDANESRPVRAAALEALSQLPGALVAPIAERADLASAPEATADEPAGVHDWLARHADAPLSAMHDALLRVHAREAETGDPAQRHAWLVARGALHAALASRESRIALYDLRETFAAAAAPLPLDFLHAMAAIGDPSCLEPVARAWAAAPAGETWWRTRLADAARDLVLRHRLSARHASVKRVKVRWPGLL